MVFAERGETISGGNFHGEYPAKVCMFVTHKPFIFGICCRFRSPLSLPFPFS